MMFQDESVCSLFSGLDFGFRSRCEKITMTNTIMTPPKTPVIPSIVFPPVYITEDPSDEFSTLFILTGLSDQYYH